MDLTLEIPRGRIDVHAHAMPPIYVEAAESAGLRASIASGFPDWRLEGALEFMDRNDIAYTVNSISPPGVHFGDDAKARALARRCNDFLADVRAQRPTRFGALGVVPLPDVKGALLEIDYCLDVLRLDGLILFASYGGDFLGDPVFDPILERLSQARAIVFIHPNSHPTSLSLGMRIPTFLVEYPFATTRAVANLIFSGAMRRFPNIRIILAHNGGAIPFLSWRLAMGPLIDERLSHFTQDEVLAALAEFYYESAQAAGPAPMAALAKIAPSDKLLFGTDWPYCPESVTTAGDAALGAAATNDRLFRDNALRLFRPNPC